MSHSFLRAAHQTVLATHQASVESAHLAESLLYFLITYIVLVIVAVLFLRAAANNLFVIPISPNHNQQMMILGTVIVILGGVGFYAAVDHAWSSDAWLFYGISNLLLAAFIFFYQTGRGFSLIVSAILMSAFAVVMYWLFRDISYWHHGGTLILFFLGAVEAFGFVWAVYVIGQTMVHECGTGTKSQTICFFMTVVVVLAVVCFWHIHHHVSGLGLIGFLVTGVALVILMFTRNQHGFW